MVVAVEAEQTPLERTRVGEGRVTGLITEWKGHMGWISPLVKLQHPQAKRHWGLIYLAAKDKINGIREGRIVDFMVYEDADGLGAEDVRVRSVLRLTIPHQEARSTLKDSPQWSEFLTDSEYYPSFEREHRVLLRKYAWPLPFVLVELWGQPEELPAAALALATKGSAEGESSCTLQLILSEEDVDKVEGLPEALRSDLKISEAAVLHRPLTCRSVSLEAPREKCCEAITALLKVLAPPTTVLAAVEANTSPSDSAA